MIDARKIIQPIYPLLAIREFVGNALVHQDFAVGGIQPTVSIFSNRIEITNSGVPEISTERFIDKEKARNEKMAQAMREVHLCEQRGSGIDNSLIQIGLAHLPTPIFSAGEQSTTVVVLGPKEFTKMDTADRVRVCYHHCVLQYVIASHGMTNETLRTRFGLDNSYSSTISRIIGYAIEQNLVKAMNADSSRGTREYIPSWA
jgi:predicted HTH transcriptional regulator